MGLKNIDFVDIVWRLIVWYAVLSALGAGTVLFDQGATNFEILIFKVLTFFVAIYPIIKYFYNKYFGDKNK